VSGAANITGTRTALAVVSSRYDPLNAKLQKRFSHGLLAQASYTWSKSLESGSNSLPTAYTNTASNLLFFDPRLRGSVADFDILQILVLSGTWEIPGAKKPGTPAAWLLSGSQLGTLLQLNAGLSFTLPGCGSLVNPGNATEYIKLSCFVALASASRLGDADRNVAHGPGLINWDASLFKSIPVTRLSESFRIQFRFEVFNALNRTDFNPPTSTSNQLFTQALVPVASAGNLTSTATTSRQLQFAIKVLW
jgi:hypothetical protein